MIETLTIFDKKGEILYGDPSNELNTSKKELTTVKHNDYTLMARFPGLNEELAVKILTAIAEQVNFPLLEKNFIRFLEKIENTIVSFDKIEEKIKNEIKIDVVERVFCILNDRGRVFKSIIMGEIKMKGIKQPTEIIIKKPEVKIYFTSDVPTFERYDEIVANVDYSGHDCAFRYVVGLEPPLKIIKIAYNKFSLNVSEKNIKNLEIRFPISEKALCVKPKVQYGSVDVEAGYVIWKITQMLFKNAYIEICCDMYEDSDKNIEVTFSTDFFPASGLLIKKVEPIYDTNIWNKSEVWIRYLYETGKYEIRNCR